MAATQVESGRRAAGGGPPFPVGPPTTASWREHTLTRVAELRFLLLWLRAHADEPDDMLMAIHCHLDAAADAAAGHDQGFWRRLVAGMRGASVERAVSHLDAAETEMLRIAPGHYLRGQMPSLVAFARSHLAADDPRMARLRKIAERARTEELEDVDRDTVVATTRVASREARREVTRVRSFRNLLLVTALVMTMAAAGMVVLGALSPATVPVCFNPDATVVCPTGSAIVKAEAAGQTGQAGATPQQDAQTAVDVDDVVRATAGRWDVPLVMLIGLMAAAVAAAATLRNIRGTSTPFSLPIALAVLKLPTGALTALLGLLLMRGQFVPGLSALDSSAQILAWAIVFGYAQQLLTRFVDQRAQGVLDDVAPTAKPGDPACRAQAGQPAI